MFKTLNVLVVDDASPMRDFAKYILRKVWIEKFYEASNADKAFEILESTDISLVVADWNVPKLNGLELVAKIRNDDGFKALPVIMVTGEGEKTRVVEAIQSGASDYVAKPISGDILL